MIVQWVKDHLKRGNFKNDLHWSLWKSILSLGRFGAMTDDWNELLTYFNNALQTEKRFARDSKLHWDGFWLYDYYPLTASQQKYMLGDQEGLEIDSSSSSSSSSSLSAGMSNRWWATIEIILSHCKGVVYKKAAMNLMFLITKQSGTEMPPGAALAGLCLVYCNGKEEGIIKLNKSLLKDLMKRPAEPVLSCVLIGMTALLSESTPEGI